MNSIFSSFDAFSAELLGQLARSSESCPKSSQKQNNQPTRNIGERTDKSEELRKTSGNMSKELRKTQPTMGAQFAQELDGLNCFETMELKERIERVKEKGSRDTELKEMMDIREDFVAIHGEMVLLKNYSSLNFAGLLKILKKYDKRTGELLRLPFTQLAVHQPFFTTEPLTRLVHECEENLELLFPLEAEVVESPSVAQDQMEIVPGNPSNDCLETTLLLGEETVDIYRSTLAAMRAIKGLKKASSTCNPLSFSSLFGNPDNDNTGVVTAENSPCNSSATLQNGGEADEDETDAPI